MTRAHPPWRAIAVVAVVVASVIAADLALWRVFVAERDDAVARADSERRLLETAARAALRTQVDAALVDFDARAARAVADPLASDEGLVLVVDGAPLLPRRRATARALALRDPAAIAEPDDEALALARAVERAGTSEALEAAVRAFLAHRAHHRLAAPAAVALDLRVVDVLSRRADVDTRLMRALLIEGMEVGAARIAPLAATLLTAGDTVDDDARDAFRAACGRAGVDCALFDARWDALASPGTGYPIPGTPGVLRATVPTYLEQTGPRGARGVRLPEDTSARIEAQLRAQGLLREGDALALSLVWRRTSEQGRVRDNGALFVPIDEVPVALRSPRLDAAADTAALRFRLKAALLGVLTLLAGGLIAAALLDGARRRRYDALRSGFVAAVSHELRTPLASMRLIVESLLARFAPHDGGAAPERGERTDGVAERLARLGRDVDGLEFLVENVLSFSRLERGRLEPRRERTSLAEIVADAVERARGDDAAVGIHVHIENEGVVHVDAELVGIVVSNLVRNAWQHNPRPHKRVDVIVRGADGRALVDVRDDGPGIAPADRERIFEEFQRGARPTTRGTGLGLALCRQIARVHGGDVTLARTGDDGSTFTLALPA